MLKKVKKLLHDTHNKRPILHLSFKRNLFNSFLSNPTDKPTNHQMEKGKKKKKSNILGGDKECASTISKGSTPPQKAFNKSTIFGPLGLAETRC